MDDLKSTSQIRNNEYGNNDYSSLMRSVQNINLNDNNNNNKNFNNIDLNINQNHYPSHENTYNSKYQHSHQSSQNYNNQYYSYQQMLQQRGQQHQSQHQPQHQSQQHSQQPTKSDNVFLNNNKNEIHNSHQYQSHSGYDDILNKERSKRFTDAPLQDIWNQDNSSNDHFDSDSGQDTNTVNKSQNVMENKFESMVKEREEMSELLSDLNNTNDQLQKKLLSKYFKILDTKSKKHPII
ncbi:unnamed protein product [[Candida] boidinii]|uniref:Unnamed protein product n=1 Tax=Candida boidinii TaxID=5477 RepID=A0ACB5U0Z0_CANBO|nr:unnamed protein product [[Candida] boidinii]